MDCNLTHPWYRKMQQGRSSLCMMRMREQPVRQLPSCVSEDLKTCSCSVEVRANIAGFYYYFPLIGGFVRFGGNGIKSVAVEKRLDLSSFYQATGSLCPPSTGLKVIAQKFPSGMTTGSIPTSCLSSPTSSKGKKCNAPQQPAEAADKRWQFTSDELAKIQEQLEEILITSSTNSKDVMLKTWDPLAAARYISRIFSL